MSIEDLRVVWAGSTVALLLASGRVATVLSAEGDLARKVKHWCVKNNYRCSSLRNELLYV